MSLNIKKANLYGCMKCMSLILNDPRAFIFIYLNIFLRLTLAIWPFSINFNMHPLLFNL